MFSWQENHQHVVLKVQDQLYLLDFFTELHTETVQFTIKVLDMNLKPLWDLFYEINAEMYQQLGNILLKNLIINEIEKTLKNFLKSTK